MKSDEHMTTIPIPDKFKRKDLGLITVTAAAIIAAGAYYKMATNNPPADLPLWHTTHPLPENATTIRTRLPEALYQAEPLTISVGSQAAALPYDIISEGAFVHERVTVPCFSFNPARRHTTQMTVKGIDIGPSLEEHIAQAMLAGYTSLEFIARDGQRINVPITSSEDSDLQARFILLPYEENNNKQVDSYNDIILTYQPMKQEEKQGYPQQEDNLLYLSALTEIRAGNNPTFGFVNEEGERFEYKTIEDVLKEQGIKKRLMKKEGVKLSLLGEGDMALKGSDNYQAIIPAEHLDQVTITLDKKFLKKGSYAAQAPELGKRSEVYDIALMGFAK